MKGTGIQEDLLTLLADTARDASRDQLSRDHYKIITRESFESALRDNEIDPNVLKGCARSTLPRILARTSLSLGSLINIDNRYILTLKLFETENGENFLGSQKIETEKR